MDQPPAADTAALPPSKPPVLRPELVSVLASPAKLQILAVLDEHGPMTVDAIYELCGDGRTRAALYPHLQALKSARWIEVTSTTRIRGTAEETLDLTAASKSAQWRDVLGYLNRLPAPSPRADGTR